MELSQFLKLRNDGSHGLESLAKSYDETNSHNEICAHYEGYIRDHKRWKDTECRICLTVRNIEYHWNEILPNREW